MFADRYRPLRREAAIRAYVGTNGSGKTLAAVHDLLPSLDAGRTVYSTCPLYDPATGELHPAYVPLQSWRQLMHVHDADLFLDEVTGVASARAYSKLPDQLLNLFQQMRKRNSTITITAVDFMNMDVSLRRVCRIVTACQGMLPKRDPDSLWPMNRLFRWATYDAKNLEQFSLAEAAAADTADRPKLKPICSSLFWRPGKPAERAYDTKAEVDTLDHFDMGGHCLSCGHKRRTVYCDCTHDHGQQIDDDQVVIVNS